jgi:RNA polymerase sigma-70 factor (ECF subfamily)
MPPDAPTPSDLDRAEAVFSAARPRLFGIAYRMLGRASEAEDVVQDAWLRWQACDRAVVRDPAAFLATTTTRLALNAIGSARARRETYVGPWLPEPVDTSADPALGAQRDAALELALLLVLETLGPTERAAFVLREAFDYPYGEIAAILQVQEANARQLVSRARRHVDAQRRQPVGAAEQRRLLDAFLQAARLGDLAALEDLLAADVVSLTDGGGMPGAARVPVAGRERVARFVAGFATRFWAGTTLHPLEANGRPATLIRRADGLVAVLALTASPDGIDRLLWVMSPGKLTAFAA